MQQAGAAILRRMPHSQAVSCTHSGHCSHLRRELGQQAMHEHEMAKVVGADLHLKSLLRVALWRALHE